MIINYETDQLAYWGMGDYEALREMGFNVKVMVQGPPEKREVFRKTFARYGYDMDFEIFKEPWSLSEHLDGGRYDVAYLADHCRAEAKKAGVPMIVIREFDPFYGGLPPTLDHLDHLLKSFGV